MNQQGPLRWIPGTGWLILAAPAPDSEVRSQALARSDGEGVTVYVSFADDRGDALMDDMEDLGALAGYLVDFQVDRGAVLHKQLEHATMLVLETGTSLDAVLATLDEDVVDALRHLYERGAVLLIEGLAMNVFGRWVLTDGGDIVDGLGWIENAFVDPVSPGAENAVIHQILQSFAEGIGIAIGEGSALVLGGDGTVEVWGRGDVQISLGRQYSQ
jgi:hypothetical protein